MAQLARRDVIGRYRGSLLGLMWAFFNPLVMLAVYTVVFSVVFEVRWGVQHESQIDFALPLFVGLIVHALFAECVNRAPGLIAQNPNYVRKVVFPLEILPWVSVVSALFHTAVSVLVLLLVYGLVHLQLHWTVTLLPVVLLPLVLWTAGAAWILASLGIYVRDIAQTTGLITTVMLFLAPVFYPVTALPEQYQSLLYVNPLTFIIEQARNVLIWGKAPDWSALAVYSLVSVGVMWLGYAWFQRTRKGFADVI